MGHSLLTEHELRWYFYESPPGTWRWDAVDDTGELLRQSARVFESRPACVLDAKVHGYGCASRVEGRKEASAVKTEDPPMRTRHV